MHEYSLATSVIKFCREELNKRSEKKMKCVTLSAGVLAGVEINLFLRALDALKQDTDLKDTDFSVEIDPLILDCSVCRKEIRSHEFIFSCPECGSNDVKITGGKDLLIKEIQFAG